MAYQVSPGLVIQEKDLSQYAVQISSSVFGIIGGAERGPVNVPTYITNEGELISTFGKPVNNDSQGNSSSLIHAAIQYLRNGNQLWVVRVANGSADGVSGTDAAATYMAQASSTDILKIDAKTTGEWANGAAADITQGLSVLIEAATSEVATEKKITVYLEGTVVETWDNLVFGTTERDNGNTQSVDNVINDAATGSNFITVTSQEAGTTAPDDTSGTHDALAGGVNGLNGGLDSDIIGQITTAGTPTGLKLFENTDALDITMIAAPGETGTAGAVSQALVTLAEFRKDCIALIDPPQNTVKVSGSGSIREWANTGGNPPSGNAFNSSYASVHWPWVQTYDNYNGEDVWTPPSGWVASSIAYTARNADPWFAPAGLQRGLLGASAKRIETNTTLGDRELLQAAGEVINPIVNFARDGIVLWGQKTTQRTASALDRMNVRLLMIYAEKIVATSVRFLLFEQNDDRTWRRFTGIVNPIFESIQSRRGLDEFRVICDATTNPPELRDQNTMRGIIALKPTKTAEVIGVEFMILASGASFSEITS